MTENYCSTNGIELFYKKRGKGRPLLLLHGNGESNVIFDALCDKLSKDYIVYSIDSRGHGKSSVVKELDYNVMAEDIVGFIKTLELQKPILYGFSDGGIIGLIIAIKYPELLSNLIVSGVNIAPSGIKIIYRYLFRLIYFFTKSHLYRIMLTQPNIENSELKKIKVPVLITAGQNDMIKDIHTKMIAENITESELLILPKESHSSYIVNSDKMYGIIKSFCKRRF
ncbi:MAG: oxidoreductase [Clostridiales bacterium GWF2_36_10]|nr:MAG: oxidoreductase [Clostridiales bacterium GWF2_36_10]HAN21774.1 alpha/beta hydrolase [Clostridiales bacterium]